jgi:hypothetical protein
MTAASTTHRRGFSTDRPFKLYVFAGLGACAGELVSQPIDLIKTRMQLQGQRHSGQRVTPFKYAHSVAAFLSVLRGEGVRRLYAGLPPALLRALSYGSLRIGLYEPLKAALAEGRGEAHSLPLRLAAGALSGASAAALCAPADVLKIRLQSRAACGGGGGGLLREASAVVREGGVRALWAGAAPTAARAAVVAATELALYEEARERLVRRGGGGGGSGDAGTHVAAALLAGAAASLLSSPLDVLRARLMAAGGCARYGGVLGVLAAAVRGEGARALWAGVPADFARRAPHTVANYLVLEQLRARWG